MSPEKRNRTKTAIIVLAVLLGLSLVALAGTVVYNRYFKNTDTTVTLPDNLITPDEDTDDTDGSDDTGEETTADDTDPDISKDSHTDSAEDPSVTADTKAPQNGNGVGAENDSAVTLELYDKTPRENDPFCAVNMFPGDRETRYYRVAVSYMGTVTVRFRADVRPGYEKLSEVLKAKVTLLTTGEILYDGLMGSMPESLDHRLASDRETTDELLYEITAYLDTSVGNEYEDLGLVADFNWWVDEVESLTPSAQTGDILMTLLPVTAGVCVLCLILIIIKRKREDEENA